MFEPVWGASEDDADVEEQELRDSVDLWGEGIAETTIVDIVDFETGANSWDGQVHVVRFQNAPPVAFRADKVVDVIADSSGPLKDIASKSPDKLTSGDVIAFLPGVEHHSLRDALMAAWDNTLAAERAFLEPLWRAAIEDAVATHGPKGVAARCERTEGAVRSWLDGRATPQQRDDFDTVLNMAAAEEARGRADAIWQLLQRTRGMHRQIGALLNAAVSETVAGADRTSARKLEEVTRTHVGDLLDIAEALRVQSVSAPVPATAADTGRYLPEGHPLLKERTV
jgi:hypothetical protein